MRILALDVGDKNIGVAVSDELLITAQGVGVIQRSSLDRDRMKLEDTMKNYEVSTIVIGLPKNMNGTIGPRGEAMMIFAATVEEWYPTMKIQLWDERLSTVAAEKLLIEANLSRAKRKKVIDKIAAVFILQGYLDSLKNPKLP